MLPLHSVREGRCTCGDTGCKSSGKHPLGKLTPNGLKDATRDETIIREWWLRCPDANVGVVTGAVSGLVVLDVDPRNGGFESQAALEQACGKMGPTLTSRTGGGGWHYVYRHPGGHIKGRANALGDKLPGLDIKGDGGYFVAPPSAHHSGETYMWKDAGVTPVRLPEALSERLTAKRMEKQGAEQGGDDVEEGEYREGTRNMALTRLAGRLRACGLERATIEAALLAENAVKCRPQLDDAEVRGIAASVGRYPARTGGKGGIPAATRLMMMAEGAELFHTRDGDAYATITVGEHRETWALRARQFRQWLARRFYQACGAVPNSQALQDALALLEGRAIFEGREERVFLRVAERGGALYVDLANEQWQAVEVTRDGWDIVAEAPVKFRRTHGMAPLPVPEPGGAIEELLAFVNVGSEGDWRLMVAWLVAALRERGPYPLLVLQGEQGTAKSTTARALRGLVDPCDDSVRALPRDERDLVIAANNRWALAFDNLSGVTPWMADILCRLATGESFATRQLFSDDGEKIFNVARPLILNGIEEIATRQDLADRALVLTLPPINEEMRRTEDVFWRDFAAARPRILGALLDGASTALRTMPTIQLARLPRMADFAMWAAAAETGFGWPAGAFMETYDHNRGEAVEAALEADSVANAVRILAETRGSWTGTATELLATLGAAVSEQMQKGSNWPRSPRALSGRLRRAGTFLRMVGIEVDYRRVNTQRSIAISASRTTAQSSVTGDATVTTVTTVAGDLTRRSQAERDVVTQACGAVTQSDGQSTDASPVGVATQVGAVEESREDDGRDGGDGQCPHPQQIEPTVLTGASDDVGMEARGRSVRHAPRMQLERQPSKQQPSWWPQVERLVGQGMRQDEAIHKVLVERGALGDGEGGAA